MSLCKLASTGGKVRTSKILFAYVVVTLIPIYLSKINNKNDDDIYKVALPAQVRLAIPNIFTFAQCSDTQFQQICAIFF